MGGLGCTGIMFWLIIPLEVIIEVIPGLLLGGVTEDVGVDRRFGGSNGFALMCFASSDCVNSLPG